MTIKVDDGVWWTYTEIMPVPAALVAEFAQDVKGNINPDSVTINGQTVIDENGPMGWSADWAAWSARRTWRRRRSRPKGDKGDRGEPGPQGPAGQDGAQGFRESKGFRVVLIHQSRCSRRLYRRMARDRV